MIPILRAFVLEKPRSMNRGPSADGSTGRQFDVRERSRSRPLPAGVPGSVAGNALGAAAHLDDARSVRRPLQEPGFRRVGQGIDGDATDVSTGDEILETLGLLTMVFLELPDAVSQDPEILVEHCFFRSLN